MEHLIEYFKKHVAERPNDIFCVAGNKRLTFAEVDKLTDSIDPSYTVRCGERVVGFSVPRDEKMVLGAPLNEVECGKSGKPAAIAREIGVSPENFMYLGDTAVDMKCAVNAGMHPIGVLWGFRTAEELTGNGAEHLISEPMELTALLDR